MLCVVCVTCIKQNSKYLLGSNIVGSGKFAEHKVKNPLGTAYLKSPIPFASVLPPAVSLHEMYYLDHNLK